MQRRLEFFPQRDVNGSLLGLTEASGDKTSHSYDGLNLPTEEQTPQGDVTYPYDNASPSTTPTLPYGVTVAYTSDCRVTESATTSSSGAWILRTLTMLTGGAPRWAGAWRR